MGITVNHIILCCLLATNRVQSRISYPEVLRDSTVVEDYYGTKVADPYRWLEDGDSSETKQFVQEQQNLTQSFLNEIPSRGTIHQRLTNVWNYPKSSAPRKVANKYYNFENSGLQNQSILYVKDNLNAASKVFLDPNRFSLDGTISLDSYAFSHNGELFTYATTESGSDWKVIHFINASNGENLPDLLLYSKWPNMDWSHDNNGIFYARYDSPTNNSEVGTSGSGISENSRIFYHRIGTSQKDDILIAESPEFPKRRFYAEVSHCGGYLIVTGQDIFSANAIYIASLSGGITDNLKGNLVPIFPSTTEATYKYIANEGSTFLFETSKDAPNNRLITVTVHIDGNESHSNKTSDHVDENNGQYSFLSTFLEAHPEHIISWASVVNKNKLLVCYLEDVKNTLELRSLKNSSLIQKLEFPPGTISSFTSDGTEDREFFFVLQNFLSPGTIYQCHVDETANCKIFKQLSIANTDLSAFLTEQIFYPSKDGTLIPMYVLRKKDTPLDGTAPALLYGYGGFNSNLLPRFSSGNLVFVDHFNGIYVSANLRGGGEYGDKWHKAGSLHNKQNVFDDFHAAAEYLIKNNYTRSSKLAIKGGSNGGLLVAACINQRPELYGAGIAEVGVMDMLRFQKFTIGYAWCAEYGCSDDKEYFQTLIKYSPLHNVHFPADEHVQYPSVLVTTADHDDRVVPAHSYKYIAELQSTIGRNSRQTNPLLLRVDVKAGHGAGKPTSKKIDEISDIYAFLSKTLDLETTDTSTSKLKANPET